MTRNGVQFVIATAVLLWVGWSTSSQPSAGPASQASGSAPASANLSTVTKAQFERWMTELSNLGRWGKEDERGALNLITVDKRRQAAALAKNGLMVSLSRPIRDQKPESTSGPRPVRRGGASAHYFLTEPS